MIFEYNPVMSDLIKVFTHPLQVFSKFTEKPKILLPLIIILLTTIAYSIIYTRLVFVPHRFEMYDKQDIPLAQVEKMEEAVQKGTIYILNVVASFIYVVLGLVSVTLFFYLFFPVLGHDVNFFKTLSIITHAALIRIPAFLLKTPLVIMKGNEAVYTGLGIFFTSLGENNFLFKFFARFDLFTCWEVILIGLGMSVISRLTRKTTLIIAIVAWIAVNLILSLVPIGR